MRRENAESGKQASSEGRECNDIDGIPLKKSKNGQYLSIEKIFIILINNEKNNNIFINKITAIMRYLPKFQDKILKTT